MGYKHSNNLISFSANTISATTFFSGSTDLSDLFGSFSNSPFSGNSSLGSAMMINGGNIASGTLSHSIGQTTSASSFASHSEGVNTLSSGIASHTEGFSTTASGNFSHSEGFLTKSLGIDSHSEGNNTTALGNQSHVEGQNSIALGLVSHAEGSSTLASGDHSHAEGLGTTASGDFSHAEGFGSESSGNRSHAGGYNSVASGATSFVHSQKSLSNASQSAILGGKDNLLTSTAIRSIILGGSGITGTSSNTVYGVNFNASGQILSGGTDIGDLFGSGRSSSSSPFSGNAITGSVMAISGGSVATGLSSFSTGFETLASGIASHSEGQNTTASGDISHAEGFYTVSSGEASHAEGNGSKSIGEFSHAEGDYSTASGDISHAEGDYSVASGIASHAEGKTTTASGDNSHAEGFSTIASGINSHAEGNFTSATGVTSHAQGFNTKAFGFTSHAQGFSTKAIGTQSHAEGNNTTAFGTASHSEGTSTVASGNTSHAGGNASRAIAQNSFVHSKTSDVEAEDGAILGGELNKLTSTANRSIILGGLGITGSTADTVYGNNFNASANVSGASFFSGSTDIERVFSETRDITQTTGYTMYRNVSDNKITTKVIFNDTFTPFTVDMVPQGIAKFFKFQEYIETLHSGPSGTGGESQFTFNNLDQDDSWETFSVVSFAVGMSGRLDDVPNTSLTYESTLLPDLDTSGITLSYTPGASPVSGQIRSVTIQGLLL